MNRRTLLATAAAAGVLAPGSPFAAGPPRAFPKGVRRQGLEFANREIAAASLATGTPAPAVSYQWDPSLAPQSYRIAGDAEAGFTIIGGDMAAAMYGGLRVAEAIRLGPDALARLLANPNVHSPHILQRGIKFNIPLDLRQPTYSDHSTAAEANIPEVWTREFWAEYFDEMARDRYNVMSIWNSHPFPSMVKVPEYPDVALDDVWRTREPLSEDVSLTFGGDAEVNESLLKNHEIVKTITIDQKIAFWRDVMQMAADRGIVFYIFTWNVFTHGATGKYGIDTNMSNANTISYMRASVRQMVQTYPLLAGIGITAGENMPTNPDHTREGWLWATYGEGVRDGLKGSPERRFNLIHRFHLTSGDEIEQNWKDYPGYPETFSFSYKYSVSHMYSSTRPPFISEVMPLLTGGLKTWLTVRNDDIYSFRWGDPDFARDYIVNMPPSSKMAGFYMGCDGFTWGRDFLDREYLGKDLGAKRPLVMQKQWYSFMLWGRLAYDPNLSNAHFEATLRARHPAVDAATLFAASTSASKVIPQINRFFWKSNDVQFLAEAGACRGMKRTAVYRVTDFINGICMPGTGILNIREWRYRLAAGSGLNGISPLECAAELEGAANTTLALVGALRRNASAQSDRELRQTLGDYEAMAYLGIYYAEKIRGACDLALYDASGQGGQQADAMGHIERALEAWKSYAAVRDAQYVPALYNRIGFVDLTALTEKVARDIDIVRTWKVGSIVFDPGAPVPNLDSHLRGPNDKMPDLKEIMKMLAPPPD